MPAVQNIIPEFSSLLFSSEHCCSQPGYTKRPLNETAPIFQRLASSQQYCAVHELLSGSQHYCATTDDTHDLSSSITPQLRIWRDFSVYRRRSHAERQCGRREAAAEPRLRAEKRGRGLGADR